MKVKGYAHQRVTVTLPYTEVMMHLRVAGRKCKVEVLPGGAQLLDDDNQPLSFPVTHGEAGIEYLGEPKLSDHHECNSDVTFSGTWHCYTHEIYSAPF